MARTAKSGLTARFIGVALAVCLGLSSLANPSFAVEPDEIMADAGQESRARALSLELRCLVCQNQSIDDSNAPLARDLRLLVRNRILAGDSDAQVKAFLVARYGEFVLLRPPVNPQTWLLWGLPFLALIAGAALAMKSSRRRVPSSVMNTELNAEERARLEHMLAEDTISNSSRKA